MARSLVTEVVIRKTVRFEVAQATGSGKDFVNVFVDTERSTKCIGWVTETQQDNSLEPEVVAAAREFLKGD
jgi:hypothetical protein